MLPRDNAAEIDAKFKKLLDQLEHALDEQMNFLPKIERVSQDQLIYD
jgi:hypothetical protein